jgi:hypothetical protein
MDPKRLQEIKDFTDSIIIERNKQALGHYARLLQACGVRQLRIYRTVVQP